MFQKHIYVVSNGDYKERNDGTNYYMIYDLANGRYIDPDHYVPYLEWGGTPGVVDVTPPEPVVDTSLTIEQRMDALENSFLEDLMTRLI